MNECKEAVPQQQSHLEALSDVEVVGAIKGRNQRAVAELYDRHSVPLYSLAQRILGHPDSAGDALEEAFLDVWKQADTFDERRCSVFTWLVLLTRRRALERFRARPARERAEAPAISNIVVRAPSPIHAARRRNVRAALAGLPASDREILEASFFEGLTLSEIASRARLPEEVVRARAVQAIKGFLEPLRGEVFG